MMPGLRVGAESPTIPPKYHLVQYVCIYLIQLGGAQLSALFTTGLSQQVVQTDRCETERLREVDIDR